MSRADFNVAIILFIVIPVIMLVPITIKAKASLGSSPDYSEDDALGGFDESIEIDRGSDLDELLNDFDENIKEDETSEAEQTFDKTSSFDLSGATSSVFSYNFAHEAPRSYNADYRCLSSLKAKIDLELQIEISKNWEILAGGKGFYDFIYLVKGRDEFTDETIDLYEKEIEPWEMYVEGMLLPNLDVRIGRQIVVWGKADNIRVVDVLNPLDSRVPGIVDIEDLRLPVTMSKIDFYYGKWNMMGIAVNEIRFNKDPVYGSDFYSFPFDTREETPANIIENTECALALNGIFSGWDIFFCIAQFYDDKPYIQGSLPVMERHHSRLNMAGMSLNIAMGNWLLKTEAAYFHGREYYALPDEEKSRIDMLIGFDFSGFTDTTLSLEAVNRHLIDYDSVLKELPDCTRENETQAVLSIRRDLMNDNLHLVAFFSIFGITGEGGSFERYSVEYSVIDAFSIMAGVILYQSGNQIFLRNIGDKDRLFCELKYSF